MNKCVKISLVPSLRAKSNSLDISFDNFLIKNVAAKGKRLANRGIRRILQVDGKSEPPEQRNLPLPGLSPTKTQGHDAEEGGKNGGGEE
jgi:hypothetical protein